MMFTDNLESLAQEACLSDNTGSRNAAASMLHTELPEVIGNLASGVPFGLRSTTNQEPNDHVRFTENSNHTFQS